MLEIQQHSEQIYNGAILNLRKDKVRVGNQIVNREVIEHSDAVFVLAITPEDEILFVKQFRYPVQKYLIEIPAGKVERGEENNLSSSALRELEEETGYTSNNLELVQSFYSSAGFTNEKLHIFIAKDLIKLENPPKGDEDEYIELIKEPLKKIIENYKNYKKLIVQDQEIDTAGTVVAIQHLLLDQR